MKLIINNNKNNNDPKDPSQLFAREELLQITSQYEADTAAYGKASFIDVWRKAHIRKRMLIGSLNYVGFPGERCHCHLQ